MLCVVDVCVVCVLRYVFHGFAAMYGVLYVVSCALRVVSYACAIVRCALCCVLHVAYVDRHMLCMRAMYVACRVPCAVQCFTCVACCIVYVVYYYVFFM